MYYICIHDRNTTFSRDHFEIEAKSPFKNYVDKQGGKGLVKSLRFLISPI